MIFNHVTECESSNWHRWPQAKCYTPGLRPHKPDTCQHWALKLITTDRQKETCVRRLKDEENEWCGQQKFIIRPSSGHGRGHAQKRHNSIRLSTTDQSGVTSSRSGVNNEGNEHVRAHTYRSSCSRPLCRPWCHPAASAGNSRAGCTDGWRCLSAAALQSENMTRC